MSRTESRCKKEDCVYCNLMLWLLSLERQMQQQQLDRPEHPQ